MNRLCDEVIHLIFYELPDPTSLILTSKRFYICSQDPYVRAHYFLSRYGHTQAMYYALGRGKILTERVLDILVASGARLSRYLIQIAIHHYFHTQAHFIKTPWVRNVPLQVFAYFLTMAARIYGEIPRGKGDDDGSIFSTFLKESRYPPQMKLVGWEVIKEILEKYNFIPFCNKDPIMAQFPLALAIEPRLLPHAVANGFHMDSKYRDFVFRKMFERLTPSSETRAEDIAHNVRELCRLDPTMFVSRTVAAEVCMEAKVNDAGYTALKQLDKSGHLRFELGTLVEDLLQTFLQTRSITNPITIDILRYLFADFPSTDPTVRLVILITVFISSENLHTNIAAIHTKLEALHLTPVSRRDVFNVLINPFVDRYQILLDYARREVIKEDGSGKGMGPDGIRELVQEVVCKCLEVACKGKLLKKLYEGFPSIQDNVMRHILENHQIRVEDLPSWDAENGREMSARYEAKLCQDFMRYGVREVYDEARGQSSSGGNGAGRVALDVKQGVGGKRGDKDVILVREDVIPDPDENAKGATEEEDGDTPLDMDLGIITQESLTTMIRHDEVTPARSRRRTYYPFGTYGDSSGKLRYPHDPLHVGRWAKTQFGTRSSVMAIFMTHAVLNDNGNMLHQYFVYVESGHSDNMSRHVPVTFKHFQLLARLGRAPNVYLFREIELGAEFFMDEDDYITKTDAVRRLKVKVKTETAQPSIPTPSYTPSGRMRAAESSNSPSSSSKGKKRPRRSAAAVRSYAVPDSDDEAIMEVENEYDLPERRRPGSQDTSLQRWLKHLGELCREEQRKYKEAKRQAEMAAEPGTKTRVAKTEFLKVLSFNLRNLRKVEEEKRIKMFGLECHVDEYSDEDDEEYLHHKVTRGKRRRVVVRS